MGVVPPPDDLTQRGRKPLLLLAGDQIEEPAASCELPQVVPLVQYWVEPALECAEDALHREP